MPDSLNSLENKTS